MKAGTWRPTGLGSIASGFITSLLLVALSTPVCADDPPAQTEKPRLPTIQLQLGDDPATPLENPLRGNTSGDRRHREALAHFMAGELALQRGRTGDALEELRKAIELDPTAVAPYQLFIPAAVSEERITDAQEMALKATVHAADGVQMLRGLIAVLVQQGRTDLAVTTLEQAVALKELKRNQFPWLILHRHLGQTRSLLERFEPAADAYATLMDALQENEAEGLTADQRSQLFGENGALFEEMGDAFLKARQPERAVAAFERAAELRKSVPGIHGYNLAHVFRQTGKPERALEELEKYLNAQLIEKGRAPYQLLKELLTELDRADELIPRLSALRERDPRNKFLAYFLADEYVALGKLDEAAELYDQVGGTSSPEALVGRAAIAWRQSDLDVWLDTAGRAFATLQLGNPQVLRRLSPEFREIGERFLTDLENLAEDKDKIADVMRLGRDQSDGDDPELEFEQAWILGRLAVAASRTDDATHFYRYAIGMQNLPAYDLYRELGAHLVDVEKYAEAEQIFQEAADHPSLEPIRPYFLSLVSAAREYDERIDDAIAAIEEARRISPDEPQWALQHARIYYRARRWEDAIRIFEEMKRQFRNDPDTVRDVQFSISAVYVQMGELEKGEQVLLEVLEKEPDHPQANNDLGYLWADRGVNLERAHQMILKAIEAEPDNAAYLDSLGWVLYRLGKYEEAIQHLERATTLERGDDPTIVDHLGDALDKLGRRDEAVKAWQKALELENKRPSPDQEMIDSLKSKLADQPQSASDEAPQEGQDETP